MVVSGRGAGVARTFGVGEAGGSNPLVPTNETSSAKRLKITGSRTGPFRTGLSFRVWRLDIRIVMIRSHEQPVIREY
jgi:hypothetical protein